LILKQTVEFAKDNGHEYVTPEHLLYVISTEEIFIKCFSECGGNINKLREDIMAYLYDEMDVINSKKFEPRLSVGFKKILVGAKNKAISCEKYDVKITHIISCILELKESFAKYFIDKQGIKTVDLIYELCQYDSEYNNNEVDKDKTQFEEENNTQKDVDDMSSSKAKRQNKWKKYTVCLNDIVDEVNPLIGREKEVERTIQILCRKDKNNPLHIGEAGVGKTAITYGIAKLINDGNVPECLLDSKIYMVDLGGMIAGTQYRGEFEKRFKQVMQGLSAQDNPIVYFDEIHNIVGAGAVNGGSFDVSNMLKPYLADGKIRFIGATTYEEYKKYFSKSKSLLRRFQNVDIKEPTESEAVQILKGLKRRYEKFHDVVYKKGVIEHAVSVSARYINERFLPDKAIDLLDEAGAYKKIHMSDTKKQYVDKKLIDDVLSRVCNIPKKQLEKNEAKTIKSLEKRLSNRIFGQEEAISQVVNTVKFSKAGLLDEDKPLASFLFVGPTGVGKTQVCKTLAKELGIELIRFDMSEYSEKHSVAKLVGSPAGYVGYEEGGLLTEEVRKHPHAVLLLDEMEKAHSDVYNVLLQVMDYATLTDNQGRVADFRNIILIMTSNAGADKVGKELVGFGNRSVTSDAIMDTVKKTFMPEFRNRLNKIVVFNNIDEKSAYNIINIKIKELADKMANKNIDFSVTSSVIDYIFKNGISKEYGARQIDRIISNDIKPILVDHILFGKLKKGGVCKVDCNDNKLMVVCE